MKNKMRNVVATLVVVAAGYAGSVAAQDSDRTAYFSNKGEVMHCESEQGQIMSCGHVHMQSHAVSSGAMHCVATGNGRTYCGKTPAPFVVKGERNSAVCVEGSTWGMDNGSLWVSGGCSAFFPATDNATAARN